MYCIHDLFLYNQVVVEVVDASTVYNQAENLIKIAVQAPSDPDLILKSPRTLIQDLTEHALVREAASAWSSLVPFGSARHAPLLGGYYNGVQLTGESVRK